MDRKKNLLSIGEISLLTGASIKSLRYYERIRVLEPDFVDPYSSYRYYAHEQVYLIGIIMLWIELDIPLKDLKRYIDENKTIDFSALLAYGKEVAEKKLKVLRKGLQYIEDVQQKIALSQKYHQGPQVYSREIPEKFFAVMPYEKSFENRDMVEVHKILLDLYPGDDPDEPYSLLEYGYMCEHTPLGVSRYVIMELPERKAKPNVKVIPAGVYFCTQSEESQIEQARQIFRKQLGGADSFLAIETEAFSGKFKVNKPVNELRVLR